MAWRVFSVSTSDWQTKVQVVPTTAPYARAMGTGRQEQMVFDVLDPKNAKKINETTTAPWERLLVMEFLGQIIYAGFITDADYDRDAGTVTVYHEDTFSLWRKRIMAGTVADGMQSGPALVFNNVTLPTLVKQAFYNGQNDAARFNVPIVLPADVAGTQSRKYDPWELPTVASVVEDLMSTEGGPDIDLFPRWRDDGSLEWFLRMGDLTEGAWSWDVSAPLSRVSGFKMRKSGDNMANRIIAVGEGSEKKMLLSVQDGSATSSFLPLDVVKSYKDEKVQANLEARARADLAACSKPTEQVSMDVEMGDNFTADMLRLGGTVTWRLQDDPFLGTGGRTARLIEFSGDLTNKIHLEFQTV
jgi:hypothetical protein